MLDLGRYVLVALSATAAITPLWVLAFLGATPEGPFGAAQTRWTFTQTSSHLADHGLVTPIDAAGAWLVEHHVQATGGRALVHYRGDGGEPALALAPAVSARDVRVTTRCKVEAPSGACGLVLRFHDGNNHVAASVDAGSAQVSLNVVVDGKKRTLRHASAVITTGIWQELAVEAKGDKLAVHLNGEKIIDGYDEALGGGNVGLWVPSRDLAWFDQLTVESP